jgi:hypothetical protein
LAIFERGISSTENREKRGANAVKKQRLPDFTGAEKICPICGRRFAWRKAWARTWSQVKYCSDACRGQRLGEVDARLETAILALLAECGAGKTICPSAPSRQVFGATGGLLPANMQRTRAAARRLVAAGKVAILQGGRVVDPSTARGPIRLRRCTPPSTHGA